MPGESSVFTPLIVDYNNLQFLEKSNQGNRDRVGNPNYKSTPVPINPLALDRYAYVLNSPIDNNDPSGYCVWDACILESVGVLLLVGSATALTMYMITPGRPEAFAQSIIELAEQVGAQVETSLESLNNFANRTYISQKELLPRSGDFPYVAPRQKGNPDAVPVHGGGFKDKDGNIWRRDKSQHGGPHWDVQLPNGKHLNVDDNGKITHGSPE